MSGIGLWSVLHPRIERYLDDPSRNAQDMARSIDVTSLDPTSRASTADQSKLAAMVVAHARAVPQSRAA